jgi:hypothetical protein
MLNWWCWETAMHIKRRRKRKKTVDVSIFVRCDNFPPESASGLSSTIRLNATSTSSSQLLSDYPKRFERFPNIVCLLCADKFAPQIPLGDQQRAERLLSQQKENIKIIVDNRHAKCVEDIIFLFSPINKPHAARGQSPIISHAFFQIMSIIRMASAMV